MSAYVGNSPAPAGVVLVGDTNPVGAISFFHAPPDASYLRLNGQIISKTGYPDLWTYAQSFLTADQTANPGLYRSVDANTFAVPKLDGLFIRAQGTLDANRVSGALGARQDDDNKAHTHGVRAAPGSFSGATGVSTGILGSGTSDSTGATEARPANVALVPCVKALRTMLIPSNDSRLAAIEAQLAASVLVRRLYVGTIAGAVLTQARSFGGISVARTGLGTFAVTLTPAEANANYAVLFGGGVNADTTGAWIVQSPPVPQTVNGFNFQSSTWSTTRTLMDPNYISIAIL